MAGGRVTIWHQEWFQARRGQRRATSARGIVSLCGGRGADVGRANSENFGEEGRDRGLGDHGDLWLLGVGVTEGYVSIRVDAGRLAGNIVLCACPHDLPAAIGLLDSTRGAATGGAP